jgi:hypothetical protein
MLLESAYIGNNKTMLLISFVHVFFPLKTYFQHSNMLPIVLICVAKRKDAWYDILEICTFAMGTYRSM